MNTSEETLRLGLRRLAEGRLDEAKSLLREAAGKDPRGEAEEALAFVEEVLAFRHSDLYNP